MLVLAQNLPVTSGSVVVFVVVTAVELVVAVELAVVVVVVVVLAVVVVVVVALPVVVVVVLVVAGLGLAHPSRLPVTDVGPNGKLVVTYLHSNSSAHRLCQLL